MGKGRTNGGGGGVEEQGEGEEEGAAERERERERGREGRVPKGFLARIALSVTTGSLRPYMFSAFTRNLYFLPGVKSLTVCDVPYTRPGTFSQYVEPSSHFSTS